MTLLSNMLYPFLLFPVVDSGRAFLELHVTERKWDKVKTKKVLRSSVAIAISPNKLAELARSFGIDEVMRWKSPSVRVAGDHVDKEEEEGRKRRIRLPRDVCVFSQYSPTKQVFRVTDSNGQRPANERQGNRDLISLLCYALSSKFSQHQA